MAHILHIDSSPRGSRSVSRTLSGEFIELWKQSHPEDTVTYRDIGHHPVPYVDESWIAAAYGPPESRTPEQSEAIKISDALVDEFLAADRYVVATPMWNFSIPATLKNYIDQIVRVGRTFAVGPSGYEGLVKDKKVLFVTAREARTPRGSPSHSYDLQEPYLRLIFGFIGITDVTFVHADSLALGDEARSKAVAEAQGSLQAALQSW